MFSLGDLLSLSGWPLLVMKILYDRWPWFYLQTTRLWYLLSNPEVVWDMCILLRGDFAADAMDKIVEAMSARDKDFSLRVNTAHRKEVWIKRTVFDVTLFNDPAASLEFEPGPEQRHSIHVQVREKEVTYRTSLRYLDDFLAPLFEDIERSVSPSDVNYSLSVIFEKPNPFFGLYVRRLRLDRVADFRVTFDVRSAGDGANVRVLRNALEITARSLSTLVATSRRYLCLSPGGN